MIKATTDLKWLPLYEALASDVRLKIIDLLSVKPMNNKDLASALHISGAIITFHIRKLQEAGIVESQLVRIDGGTHKLNSLSAEGVELVFPAKLGAKRSFHEAVMKIGQFSQFEIHPTCGLATTEKIIGQFDEPRFFYDPERISANIIWFGKGFIEYQIPNYLLPSETVDEIEFSLEIGSEAPGIDPHWPSDIYFHLNDTLIGFWTSPGDSGYQRGTYTPDWWPDSVNQYGLLKMIRINEQGTFVDGELMSHVTLSDINVMRNHWKLRIGSEDRAKNIGGITLYGHGFGNYNQDIIFRTYYH